MAGLFENIESAVKGAIRVGQTTGTLARTGLGWLMGDRPPVPALLRRTFEDLGATYIKLGQFIASSPSLFPAGTSKNFRSASTEPSRCPTAPSAAS